MAERNNSLDKALAIMDLFETRERLTITAASQLTGFSPTAVTRIFNSLEHAGYVYRDKLDGGYYISEKVFLLGRRTDISRQLVNVIDDAIGDLCKKCGFSVAVSVRDDVDSITAIRKDPAMGLLLVANTGDRISLHCSASGKILTAFSQDPDRVIDRMVFSEYTEKTITDREEFRHQIKYVKTEGVAYDMEEIIPGLVCVAVPVLGSDGFAICSISASGYKERVIRELYGLLEDLKAAAATCERLLR